MSEDEVSQEAQSIGPDGGTFATEDGGLTVVVPPGALDQEITMTATRVSVPNSLPVVAGTAWELGPPGLRFAEPVELTIRYDPAAMTGDPDDLRFAWVLETAGELELAVHVGHDPAAGTVTAEIRGFVEDRARPEVGASPSLARSSGASFRAAAAEAEGESTGAVAWCPGGCLPPPDFSAEYLGAREGVELTWETNYSWVSIYRAALRQCEPGETSGQYGPYTCVSSPADVLTPPACVETGTGPAVQPCYTFYTRATGASGGFTDRGLGSRGVVFWYQARGGREDDSLRVWSQPPQQVTHFGIPDPPEVPADFTATAVSDSAIRLTWQPTPTASGYELEGFFDGAWDGGTLPYSDFAATYERLEPNTQYQFRIRSVNEHGASPYAFANATTGDVPQPGCDDFSLRLDFNPVQVAGGSSDIVPVFIERAAGFEDPIELGLFSVSGGPFWSDVMDAWSFSPNPADPGETYSTFSFTMRTDVAAGDTYDFEIRGGSPLLETDPEHCTIPITFEVVQ